MSRFRLVAEGTCSLQVFLAAETVASPCLLRNHYLAMGARFDPDNVYSHHDSRFSPVNNFPAEMLTLDCLWFCLPAVDGGLIATYTASGTYQPRAACRTPANRS